MIITQSFLLNKGSEEYQEKSAKELQILEQINAVPVQRNSGIDGFLKEHFQGKPVPIKIQGEYDTIEDAIEKLERATLGKNYPLKIVVQSRESEASRLFGLSTNVKIVKSLDLQIKDLTFNQLKDSTLNLTPDNLHIE